MTLIREVKKTISPYMKSRGFLLSGNNYYYIANDIAYCIALDAPSGLLYVTSYIMPLYVPCETRHYTYGSRIHLIKGINLPPLQKNVDKHKKEEWCASLCKCIEEKILPFYKQIETPELLVKYVEKKTHLSSRCFSCPEIFIYRLLTFSYLHLGESEKACKALNQYRNMLMMNTFFTEAVRWKYLEESVTIESLIRGDKSILMHYVSSIIDNTTIVLK